LYREKKETSSPAGGLFLFGGRKTVTTTTVYTKYLSSAFLRTALKKTEGIIVFSLRLFYFGIMYCVLLVAYNLLEGYSYCFFLCCCYYVVLIIPVSVYVFSSDNFNSVYGIYKLQIKMSVVLYSICGTLILQIGY